ncbi:MAG: alginate export family protein [Phycisphaerales bacterium]
MGAEPPPADDAAPKLTDFNWPNYSVRRFDEDYRGLADLASIPARDRADELKFLPLNDERSIWFSLGGQARWRYKGFNDFNFGAPARDDDSFYFLHRYFLWGDLHLGDQVRVFVELKSALSHDRDLPGGQRTLDEDEFDLQNAFAEFRAPNDLSEELDWLVRFGRQELLYGKQRLVSPLDWSNTRRTWDGVVGRVADDGWSLDAFYTRFVPVQKYDFNERDDDYDFWGVYTTWQDIRPRLNADFYLLGQHLENLPTGDIDRYTLGARAFGSIGKNGYAYDFESAWQFGDAGAADIKAWFVATELSWSDPELESKPWIALGFDYASGDENPADGESGSFNALFPLGHAYLGYIDVVGRSNIIDARLSGRINPTEKLWLRADWHNFWRAEAADALYNAGGGIVRAGGAGTDRWVGMEFDFTAGYTFDRHWSALVGYSHFFAGDFLADTGASSDIDFWYTQLQFTF